MFRFVGEKPPEEASDEGDESYEEAKVPHFLVTAIKGIERRLESLVSEPDTSR